MKVLRIMLIVGLAWTLIGYSYKSFLKYEYRNCVFTNAPKEAILTVDIFNDSNGASLRENCAKRLGTAFSQFDEVMIVSKYELEFWRIAILIPVLISWGIFW